MATPTEFESAISSETLLVLDFIKFIHFWQPEG